MRGTAAAGATGPDLTHVGSRRTIAAGVFETTRGSLAAWIADPQTIKPGNNMLHTSVLGALMALAPRVLYQVQTADAPSWGLTPLEDQQLAGVMMWVPAGTVYAGAALAFAALWISHSDKPIVSAGTIEERAR